MKYMKYSLYVLAVAFIAGGCKKELQQSDPSAFTDVNAFTTFDHVQLGANGAFGRYSAYSFDMYANALCSDEAKIGADNNGQGALTYRYQYSADNTTGGDVIGGWSAYYRLIDQVNRVLPHVYTVTYTPAQASRRDIVQAQLLALRGLAHFGLLQAYCKNYNASDPRGVPIMLVSDPSAQPARNTMGAVMAQIEKDLADAKALFPAVTPATFTDTVMNKVNVAAYQARIALYKGDYAAAVTYATEVISSNVKPLVTGAAYTGIWTDANNNETLFRIRYATSTGIGGLWTTTSGLIYIAPSDKLYQSYVAADIRRGAFIGTNGSGNNYVNKFYTSSRGGRVVDMKCARTSEMYLIRAEAYAKQGGAGNLALGTADLNTLRAMRITGYVPQTFATSTDLTNAVLDERFKELCFEGFRFYDLRRNNLPVQRLASDASPAWQTLPAGSFRFVFPIPQTEMTVNPNMVQNDGY